MLRVLIRKEFVHVACEAKCRETIMNYAKKYSGVPLKEVSLSGKPCEAMVLRDECGCTGGRVPLSHMSG